MPARRSRAMHEIGFEALAMLRAELMTGTLGRPNNDRNVGVTAEHVMNLRGVLMIWSIAQQTEIDRHQLDDRLEPAHRGPIPDPTIVSSEIGVSRTRFSP